MLGNERFKAKSSKPVKLNIELPSYFAPFTDEVIQTRKKIKPRDFCTNAFVKADKGNLDHLSNCENLSARIRSAIMNIAVEAFKHPKIYFNRTEVSILLHMFVQLTGLEVRDMTAEEMKAFLYSTLEMTNPFALDGLCRAAMLQSPHVVGQRKNISPMDFLLTLSILLRGTLEDRCELAFHVMDIDSDGLLRKTVEFRRLLYDTFDVNVAAQNPEIDPDEPVRDTVNYLCDKLQCTINHPITLNKFKELTRQEPWVIECLLPCLPSEHTNIIFQSLFTTSVRLPSLENPPKTRQVKRNGAPTTPRTA
ncbi:unnamed protein product [Dibothriocephalus latus]|uniref:EF-hand domain-containing protein n=1 Tax=Dibothriocephalus latus TaxID=60516 RepID=A0A3P7L0Q1_DIBLA|nr:unnamed protein product [Dibothriocephalus latus]